MARKYSKSITTPIKTRTRQLALAHVLSKTETPSQARVDELECYWSAVHTKMESLCDHYGIARDVGRHWTNYASLLALFLAEDHIPGFGEESEKNRRGRKRAVGYGLSLDVESWKAVGRQVGFNWSDRQVLEHIQKRDEKTGTHPPSLRTLENRLSLERRKMNGGGDSGINRDARIVSADSRNWRCQIS